MSVENKIKELMSRLDESQQTEDSEELQEAGVVAANQKAAAATSKDSSKSAATATAGDTSPVMQGSSQKASFTTHSEDDDNLGAKNASSVSKDTSLPKSKGDAKSVKVPAMEETESEEEVIAEEQEDISSQLDLIFGEDLSEEFKSKATSIFEAAVIARVNSEMEAVVERLEEQNEEQLVEFKEQMIEKVDSYLSYVVEQWMEENQLAVESGLRTEIAEEFMLGLKSLFKEHYMEVPEEKLDVMDELETAVNELSAKLDESIEDNITLAKELTELKAAQIFEEQTKGLAATEVEKLKKLVEGVDFENEELYREKVSVIKENYFPKAQKTSPEKVLVEESGTGTDSLADNPVMSKYVQAISRTVKSR